jgi:serine/threonine protein kinase
MSRFSIARKLAEGSAVDLLLARDEATGERVVLEALRDEVSPRPELVNAVISEASLRRPLRHPNLFERRRIIVSRTGRHYWVSEPLNGGTLRAFLDGRKGMDPLEAMRLMLLLCDAVAYLHQRGYVHGNLSPEYVLVDQVAGRLWPKLLDTGLTLFRVSQKVLGQLPRVLVRPEYLAPERIQGHRADTLSDIYALGILMFELVTGAAPYSDSDSRSTRKRHLSDPLPSLPAPLQFLDPVVRGCLAKQRAARFQSVHLLRAALQEAERAAGAPGEPAASGGSAELGNETLGSYRIVAKLGEGASGCVYLGRHQHLGRTVAIKVLRPEHALHPELVARFFLEAKAANLVKHPHIAEIFDFAERPAGAEGAGGASPLCYLVMEHLEGQSLSSLLRRENLSLARTLRIMGQVCDALGAAHEAGVVHRDVKPENVFLVEHGGDADFVKLVDFGIAKLLRGQDELGHLTATGEVLGTPSFRAPEQLSGKPVDARADIYAIGTMLYRMLSGQRPFSGSLGEMLLKLTREPPAPLRDTTVTGESFPLELRTLIYQCMEKDPDRRPDTMRELGAALARFLCEPVEDEAIVEDEDFEETEDLPEGEIILDDEPDALRVRFRSKRAVLSAARTNGASLTLFIPHPLEVRQGQSVRLFARVGEDERAFDLEGVVLSAATPPPFAAKAAGFTLGFQGEAKWRAAQMLAFCAGRPMGLGTARTARYQVQVACRVTAAHRSLAGSVMDLSHSGAFVSTDEKPLRPGDRVEVRLDPLLLGLGGRSLDAMVVWKGNKRGRGGFGIRFLDPAGCDSTLIAKYAGKYR